MPPDGRRRIMAEIKSKESTLGKESRRLALRLREIARLPRFFGIRVFRLSKWLLRHFSHRKEFRRKGSGVKSVAYSSCVLENMAAIKNGLLTLGNILTQNTKLAGYAFQQVRNKYNGRWMKRDVKRRKIAKEYAPLRLRMLAMKRNDILPEPVREIVDTEFDEKIPRQSAMIQLQRRCVITSKPRGVVFRWRLSRIVFRDLADYNKLSGIERAMW
ncbi:hypothetical protein KM043_002067 [Ampulex compressa]|nr:hypothetical protein KM043_002067 [Ampulex compressa]